MTEPRAPRFVGVHPVDGRVRVVAAFGHWLGTVNYENRVNTLTTDTCR